MRMRPNGLRSIEFMMLNKLIEEKQNVAAAAAEMFARPNCYSEPILCFFRWNQIAIFFRGVANFPMTPIDTYWERKQCQVSMCSPLSVKINVFQSLYSDSLSIQRVSHFSRFVWEKNSAIGVRSMNKNAWNCFMLNLQFYSPFKMACYTRCAHFQMSQAFRRLWGTIVIHCIKVCSTFFFQFY